MAVNYDDPRFNQVEADKQQAMGKLEETYAGLIGQADQFYQQQIDASKQYAEEQSKIQQEQTDFTIQQIEQQKDQAQKDYIKEQSGAYVDWRKQSNEYGVEAEKMASSGLENTGFRESSQVSMYNTYQNRVMTAREVVNQAILNYNNGIKDAQLQNNAVLAEIHFNALQQQLELALNGFQYKNQLILEQATKQVEMDNMYWGRYQDVLQQINTENALAEEIRQYNQTYQLQLQEFNESVRQYNQDYAEKVRQFNEEIARLKAKDAEEHKMEIQKLELQKQQLAEQKRQHDAEMAFKKQQLAEEQRQFNQQMAYKSAGSSSSSSRSSGGSSRSSGSSGSSSSSVGFLPVKPTSQTNTQKNFNQASNYLNQLITSGANNNQILSAITEAQNAGAISKNEAKRLREIYNPRGHQYT